MRYQPLLSLALALPLAGVLSPSARAQAPSYTVQDLGTLGGELANALGINDLGDVVGQAETTNNAATAPFLWSNGVMTLVPGLSPGNGGRADGVNDLGHVAGSAMAPYPAGPGYVAHAFFWSPATGSIDLTPGFTGASYVYGLNDAGQMVGGASGPTGGARLWTVDAQGQVTSTAIALPGAPAGYSNDAMDINASGLVAGVGYNASFQYRAWKWSGSGAAVELPTLGGVQTIAEGVSDAGEICGTAQLPSGLHVPVKWLPDGTIVQLGLLPLPNLIGSEARAINNHGSVVGAELYIDPATGLGASASWLWIHGTKYALEDLIPPADLADWELSWAVDINDSDEIVGIAIHKVGGIEYHGRAFLMTPVAGPVGSSFCAGAGSGTACPCGNTGAAGAGCANSTGSGASLAGRGSTSVAADDLVVSASGLVPSQPVLLFAGTSAVNGGAGAAFGDGLRCAGGSVRRLGATVPGSGGAASWGPGLGAAGGFGAGDTRHLQAWYRDPAGSPCGAGFNLTQGLALTFVP